MPIALIGLTPSSIYMHAVRQALKAQSLLCSVESVCSATSYDTGTKLGCQEHEQKGRSYLGCTGGGSSEQSRELRGAGMGRVEGGGRVGEHKGVSCIVLMTHVYFHGRRPLGAAVTSARSLGVWSRQAVFRFQTLSCPLLPFTPLNILLKHQNPTITSTCLIVLAFGWASFSALLPDSSLSWAGQEERGEQRALLFSCPTCPFGAFTRRQLGAQHRPCREGQPCLPDTCPQQVLEVATQRPSL